MVFSLANFEALGRADWRRRKGWKPPDLSSGFDTARLLRARVFTPLRRAAASRPEEGERCHCEADISSQDPDVKV
jgi:hypothetical protein